MDQGFLNEVRSLHYLDPRRVLMEPEALAAAIAEFGAGLSANEVRQLGEEIRQAAAFCAGMAELWGRSVDFSPGERWGADAVIRITAPEGALQVGLLQLTQLPDESRSTISLQELINKKAGKYRDPEKLYLGVAVNRPGELDLEALTVPKGLEAEVLELWVYGRLGGDDRSQWFFYGDMLDGPKAWPVTIPGNLEA